MSANDIEGGTQLIHDVNEIGRRDFRSIQRSNAIAISRATQEMDRQFYETIDRIVEEENDIKSDIEEDLRMMYGINVRDPFPQVRVSSIKMGENEIR